jgi:hypothetical protein
VRFSCAASTEETIQLGLPTPLPWNATACLLTLLPARSPAQPARSLKTRLLDIRYAKQVRNYLAYTLSGGLVRE